MQLYFNILYDSKKNKWIDRTLLGILDILKY